MAVRPTSSCAWPGGRTTLIVLCQPDFEFVQDGCRRDAGFTSAQHVRAVELLSEFGLPYVAVTGTVEQRLQQLAVHLAQPVAA